MQEPIHPVQIAALKRMSAREKLQAVMDLWELSRQMLATQIRTKHPDWSEEAVSSEVRQRLIYATT